MRRANRTDDETDDPVETFRQLAEDLEILRTYKPALDRELLEQRRATRKFIIRAVVIGSLSVVAAIIAAVTI